MIPSLAELAAGHAARRLPKKRRNADLRRCGYDPDGEDGAAYRRLLHQAMYAEVVEGVARAAAGEHGQPPDAIVLWALPASEHAAWLANGCGEGSWAEYCGRLRAVADRLRAGGGQVVELPATVAEVLDTLAAIGQPNTPEGRAAALGFLALNADG